MGAARRRERAGELNLEGKHMLAGFDGVLVISLALKEGPVVGIDNMAMVALASMTIGQLVKGR